MKYDHELVKNLQRISNEPGQITGIEKRVFARALLYLVLKSE